MMRWWTRHLKRSILKDSSQILVLEDDDAVPSNGSLFGRAMGSAASVASSLFSDFPSAEVNFLTTGLAGAVIAFRDRAAARRRHLALAAPAPGGDWSIRAAMKRGRPVVVERGRRLCSKAHQWSALRHHRCSNASTSAAIPAALAAVRDGSRTSASCTASTNGR